MQLSSFLLMDLVLFQYQMVKYLRLSIISLWNTVYQGLHNSIKKKKGLEYASWVFSIKTMMRWTFGSSVRRSPQTSAYLSPVLFVAPASCCWIFWDALGGIQKYWVAAMQAAGLAWVPFSLIMPAWPILSYSRHLKGEASEGRALFFFQYLF